MIEFPPQRKMTDEEHDNIIVRELLVIAMDTTKESNERLSEGKQLIRKMHDNSKRRQSHVMLESLIAVFV